MRNLPLRAAALLLVCIVCAGAKPLRPYRTTAGLTTLLEQSAHAGDCDRCHSVHGTGEVTYQHALQGPNENSLCDDCHTSAWAGGSYAGPTPYLGSSHGSTPGMVWPGPEPPPRTEAGATGKCLNCHDPHGWPDQAGVIPMLAIGREETLCLSCHDGSPASANIESDLAKPFAHPTTLYSGRHTGPGESQPLDFAAAAMNKRHAECADCHNPHVSSVDRGGTPPAPELSRINLGVSRLLVHNGGAGAPPTFTFVAGADSLSAPVAEYQLCFKCHSSWTTQPPGQTDLALELNPANASYHPVEGAGRNPNIADGAFVSGWNASSLTRCVNCHGSDFEGSPRGPHGSSYRYILKGPYEASTAPRTMTSNELCFSCHSYDVYANPGSAAPVRAYSRFSEPGAVKGHAEHVGGEGVSCYSCHVTHGAAYNDHLIVTGRSPGILLFTKTIDGGTCQTSCHVPRSYTISYGR